MRAALRELARRTLPASLRGVLVRLTRRPRVGRARQTGLWRLRPISRDWGYDRGVPIDRYYIEKFLAFRSEDVRGRVLEVGTDAYTRRFGEGRVERSDVLHVADDAPGVTIVADLTRGEGIPDASFDCAIVTQTLHVIYDVRAAVGTLHRILRPGGVVLATFPGIARVSPDDMARWGDYWRMTSAAARRLFGECFPGGEVEVEAYGNVLAAAAFLHGVAVEEMEERELEHRDPEYELLLGVRTRKAGE